MRRNNSDHVYLEVFLGGGQQVFMSWWLQSAAGRSVRLFWTPRRAWSV